MTIVGRKLSTLPTPAHTPSTTSDCTTGLTSRYSSPFAIQSITNSTPMLIRSESHAPIRLNVIRNTIAIIPMKQGIAVYFPVSRRSICMLRLCSRLSRGRTTVFSQRC